MTQMSLFTIVWSAGCIRSRAAEALIIDVGKKDLAQQLAGKINSLIVAPPDGGMSSGSREAIIHIRQVG